MKSVPPRILGAIQPIPSVELSALVVALAEATAPGGTSSLAPSVPSSVWTQALTGPAAAFLARPGKDLRARFVRLGGALGAVRGVQPTDSTLDSIARVLEILHAGSLIVDDVEDRSEQRRGQPALHCLIGDALAINTGSWMYFWALAELAQLPLPGGLELAVGTLVRCHQGQALDLATRIVDLAPRDVPEVVAATTQLKTGALCKLALELGALAAGVSAERRAEIGAVGESMGCALQMLDDLGCLVSPTRRDKAFEDLRALRPTWVWAWLATTSDPFTWSRLTSDARAGHDLPALAEALATCVESTGRAAIRARIDQTLAAVRVLAPAAVVDAIAADLSKMERMYG